MIDELISKDRLKLIKVIVGKLCQGKTIQIVE